MLTSSITAMGQAKTYSVSKDSANGSQVFNGVLTLGDLNGELTFDWMKKGFSEYKPNDKITPLLKDNLSKYNLIVFLGTWCDDSHYWVPKLAKLLAEINYPENQLSMYGVDRAKTTKGHENVQYGITFVPTIIVLKDGIEAGRITESPHNGLEADLLEIISSKK